MDNRIITGMKHEELSELLFIAQKRLITPNHHDINMVSSILTEAQAIVVSAEKEERNEVKVVCAECGGHLNSYVVDGEFRVEPCPKCLQDEADGRKEREQEEEDYELDRARLRREVLRRR